jgi:uncharacterized membrane protein YgcG
MLTLQLIVPRDRSGCAEATLIEYDQSVLYRGFAVASASLVIGARHGNADCDTHKPWGHPPCGAYDCTGRLQATPEQAAEYGLELWVFRGEYGAAALAGMNGRPAFLAYGGAAGADGLMRRTQGGFRLTDELMAAILRALTKGNEPPDMKRLRIRLEEAEPPPAWQFWKRKIVAPPLSATEPTLLTPADEEPSLAVALLKRLTSKEPYGYGGASGADATPAGRHAGSSESASSSFNDSHDSNATSAGTSSSGGESGGGGASGDWSNASSESTGSGDSAGSSNSSSHPD